MLNFHINEVVTKATSAHFDSHPNLCQGTIPPIIQTMYLAYVAS